MKNLRLLLPALLMLMISCQKDVTPNVQNARLVSDDLIVIKENRSLVMNLCGIYCPPCGGWGWREFETLMGSTKDEALPIMIYGINAYNVKGSYTAVVSSKTSDTIEKYMRIGSWPAFAVNFVPKYDRQNGVNVKSEMQMVNKAISEHRNSNVIAGAALSYRYSEETGKVNFNYKMTLFEPDENGKYSLAIYLIEDSVKEYQAGHPDQYEALHPVVLRSGYRGTWGIPFKPTVNANNMTGSGSITPEAEWNSDNFKVYAVIYDQQTKGSPAFVNAAEGRKVSGR